MMSIFRRAQFGLGALVLVTLASCVDDRPVTTGPDVPSTPAFAISDGSTDGNGDFFFLPPIVDNPNLSGTFNPNLLPAMWVCQLTDITGECVAGDTTAYFPPGSASVGNNQYQISWDTDGPETGPMLADEFYRLQIALGDSVLGYLDLDPQDPDGPGQSTAGPGFYAFRLGETIPVKFWLSVDILCEVDGVLVLECITGAVIDESGGTLALDQQGDRLSVFVPVDGLPGEEHPPILVTIERLDPQAYFDLFGEECIPFFDAPQFGQCFRVTTEPELTGPLQYPALISICLDPDALPALNIPEEQQDRLQIIRFGSEGFPQGLANVPGDCPTESAALIEPPESGFFRHAALGVNALARLVLPEPLLAHGNISLGGSSSSFSNFRFALPGQMLVESGDSAVIQAGDPTEVEVVIKVVDQAGVAVENARVHFATSDTAAGPAQDSTDADGFARTTWYLDGTAAGEHTLVVSALGLVTDPVTDHSEEFDFSAEELTLTATVVGPPSGLAKDPDSNIDDAVAGEPDTLTVIVTDEFGELVEGAVVTWTCTGDCELSEATTTTGSDGTATVVWTPLDAGAQASVASVGIPGVEDATFTATVAPAAADEPVYPTVPDSATVETTLTGLTITVTDSLDNPRVGDEVTWTVGANSGSVSSASTTVGADGTTQIDWTLDTQAGDNTLTIAVSGTAFSTLLTVTGVPGDPVQPDGDGSGQGGTVGQSLDSPLSVTLADTHGNGIAGATVTWSGDGTFAPDPSVTGSDGVAEVTWTLGTTAGPQSAQASVAGFDVFFTAEADPDVADSLEVTGDDQTAFVGSTVELSVKVMDQYGNARAGDAVDWGIPTNGGSITGETPTAGDPSAGIATASWTLGPLPGANSVTVDAGGLPYTFTATGECFDGYGVASVDGVFDAAEWACADSLGFTANISGGSTPAEVWWMNSADSLYIAVRVMQSTSDFLGKPNSLRVDFDNDGDTFSAENDDAIGYDADEGVFIDEWLTAKCLNRSQSGCGESDPGSPDGHGAADNDGTWTVYELSHPLDTGDPAVTKDFSRGTGDPLGFYLTLRVGNGAQGNTQFPDFRDFHIFNIVGF